MGAASGCMCMLLHLEGKNRPTARAGSRPGLRSYVNCIPPQKKLRSGS